MCGVISLGGGPCRLRLPEQLDQLALGEVQKRAGGRARADRREMRETATGRGPRPLLEDAAELVGSLDAHATGGRDFPALALDVDDAARHGQAPDVAATGTSLPSSPASGAYVASAWSRRSSLISSGNRDAWARCDISVLLSENSMNNRGSLALRNSQIRWPRAAARTFGIVTSLLREILAAASSRRRGTCRHRRRPRRDGRTTSSACPSCGSRSTRRRRRSGPWAVSRSARRRGSRLAAD